MITLKGQRLLEKLLYLTRNEMAKQEINRYIKTFDQQMSLYEQYARKQGLQSKSLFILLWLHHNPQGITQKQLVHKTYSTKQVVSATLKKWYQKGYLEFQESQTDRREKRILLTPAGRSYAEQIVSPLSQMEEAALVSLSQSEQKHLIATSRKYYQSLAEQMTSYFQDKS